MHTLETCPYVYKLEKILGKRLQYAEVPGEAASEAADPTRTSNLTPPPQGAEEDPGATLLDCSEGAAADHP